MWNVARSLSLSLSGCNESQKAAKVRPQTNELHTFTVNYRYRINWHGHSVVVVFLSRQKCVDSIKFQLSAEACEVSIRFDYQKSFQIDIHSQEGKVNVMWNRDLDEMREGTHTQKKIHWPDWYLSRKNNIVWFKTKKAWNYRHKQGKKCTKIEMCVH